jgi:hypothetical protein
MYYGIKISLNSLFSFVWYSMSSIYRFWLPLWYLQTLLTKLLMKRHYKELHFPNINLFHNVNVLVNITLVLNLMRLPRSCEHWSKYDYKSFIIPNNYSNDRICILNTKEPSYYKQQYTFFIRVHAEMSLSLCSIGSRTIFIIWN